MPSDAQAKKSQRQWTVDVVANFVAMMHAREHREAELAARFRATLRHLGVEVQVAAPPSFGREGVSHGR